MPDRLRRTMSRNLVPIVLLIIGLLISVAAGAMSSRYGSCSDCTLQAMPSPTAERK